MSRGKHFEQISLDECIDRATEAGNFKPASATTITQSLKRTVARALETLTDKELAYLHIRYAESEYHHGLELVIAEQVRRAAP